MLLFQINWHSKNVKIFRWYNLFLVVFYNYVDASLWKMAVSIELWRCQSIGLYRLFYFLFPPVAVSCRSLAFLPTMASAVPRHPNPPLNLIKEVKGKYDHWKISFVGSAVSMRQYNRGTLANRSGFLRPLLIKRPQAMDNERENKKKLIMDKRSVWQGETNQTG